MQPRRAVREIDTHALRCDSHCVVVVHAEFISAVETRPVPAFLDEHNNVRYEPALARPGGD